MEHKYSKYYLKYKKLKSNMSGGGDCMCYDDKIHLDTCINTSDIPYMEISHYAYKAITKMIHDNKYLPCGLGASGKVYNVNINDRCRMVKLPQPNTANTFDIEIKVYKILCYNYNNKCALCNKNTVRLISFYNNQSTGEVMIIMEDEGKDLRYYLNYEISEVTISSHGMLARTTPNTMKWDELAKVITNNSKLELTNKTVIINIAHEIYNGILNMHKHGIIHRDLDSKNIFITNDPSQGNVKIGDYGMCRIYNKDNINTMYDYFIYNMFTEDIIRIGFIIGEMIYSSDNTPFQTHLTLPFKYYNPNTLPKNENDDDLALHDMLYCFLNFNTIIATLSARIFVHYYILDSTNTESLNKTDPTAFDDKTFGKYLFDLLHEQKNNSTDQYYNLAKISTSITKALKNAFADFVLDKYIENNTENKTYLFVHPIKNIVNELYQATKNETDVKISYEEFLTEFVTELYDSINFDKLIQA